MVFSTEARPTELLAVSSMEHAELADYLAGIGAALGVPVRLLRWSTAELAARLRDGDAGDWDLLLGTAATAPLERIDFGALPREAVADDRRWFSPSGFVPAFCLLRPGGDRRSRAHAAGLVAGTGRAGLARPRGAARSVALGGGLSASERITGNARRGGLDERGRARGAKPGDRRLVHRATRCAAGRPCATLRDRLDGRHARRYEYEVFGYRAGSAHGVLAQRALDWMLSAEAAAISRYYGKVVPGAARASAADTTHEPALAAVSPAEEAGAAPLPELAPLDLARAAATRAARLARWRSLHLHPTAP